MKKTEKLKLKKPDPEDFYNIQDFNDNMDALDADQALQDEAIAQARQELESARQALALAAQRLETAEQAIQNHASAIQDHTGNGAIHVTQAEKDGWNGKVPPTRKVNGKALSGDISLTAADVEALGKTETAAAATKLATSRTIRTNLASTSTASFNGTANITPGVTGTLGIGNGGTGATTAAAARSNLGVGLGKRTARFTVGTSTAGWTANDCDYLCDGTDDQVEINAAIQALPSTGGEVVILDGTYNLTAPILLYKNNVTLSGNGQSTILKRAFAGTSDLPGLIQLRAAYCTVKLFTLNGAGYSGYNDGIHMPGNGASYYNLIAEMEIQSCDRAGIYVINNPNNRIIGNLLLRNGDGILIYSGHNSISCNTAFHNKNGLSIQGTGNSVAGNICGYNSQHGIYMGGNSNSISGNICSSNTNTGIRLYYSKYNIISGNMCESNTQGIYGEYYCVGNNISGNVCRNNTVYGICVSDTNSTNITVTGNSCIDNDSGITLEGKNSTVTGNICLRGTGTSSDYTSSQHTINAKGSNTLVVGNNIMGKNYTNSGTGNTFANNKYN